MADAAAAIPIIGQSLVAEQGSVRSVVSFSRIGRRPFPPSSSVSPPGWPHTISCRSRYGSERTDVRRKPIEAATPIPYTHEMVDRCTELPRNLLTSRSCWE